MKKIIRNCALILMAAAPSAVWAFGSKPMVNEALLESAQGRYVAVAGSCGSWVTCGFDEKIIGQVFEAEYSVGARKDFWLSNDKCRFVAYDINGPVRDDSDGLGGRRLFRTRMYESPDNVMYNEMGSSWLPGWSTKSEIVLEKDRIIVRARGTDRDHADKDGWRINCAFERVE